MPLVAFLLHALSLYARMSGIPLPFYLAMAWKIKKVVVEQFLFSQFPDVDIFTYPCELQLESLAFSHHRDPWEFCDRLLLRDVQGISSGGHMGIEVMYPLHLLERFQEREQRCWNVAMVQVEYILSTEW